MIIWTIIFIGIFIALSALYFSAEAEVRNLIGVMGGKSKVNKDLPNSVLIVTKGEEDVALKVKARVLSACGGVLSAQETDAAFKKYLTLAGVPVYIIDLVDKTREKYDFEFVPSEVYIMDTILFSDSCRLIDNLYKICGQMRFHILDVKAIKEGKLDD